MVKVPGVISADFRPFLSIKMQIGGPTLEFRRQSSNGVGLLVLAIRRDNMNCFPKKQFL